MLTRTAKYNYNLQDPTHNTKQQQSSSKLQSCKGVVVFKTTLGLESTRQVAI